MRSALLRLAVFGLVAYNPEFGMFVGLDADLDAIAADLKVQGRRDHINLVNRIERRKYYTWRVGKGTATCQRGDNGHDRYFDTMTGALLWEDPVAPITRARRPRRQQA